MAGAKKKINKKEVTVGLKIPPKIMAEEKKKKFGELPKFKIEKKESFIVLPEKGKIDFRYPLMEPFVYARIKWDDTEGQLIYNVVEPTIDENDKKLYDRVVEALLEVLDVELSAMKITDEAIDYLEKTIKEILEEYEINISEKKFLRLMYYIYRNFVGLNEIEPMMNDPYIEDISCDGVNVPLFVIHRKYGSIKTNIVFKETKNLREMIVKLAERTGRFISYAEPLLDGSLPDGSRVQASFSKDITTRGPTFTIRKFVKEPISPIQLIESGTVSSDIMSYLWMAVESGASIIIGGGAGTGKTTVLNSLSMFIPHSHKIVSVEDTRELNLINENWIPAVSRTGFGKGLGEVTMFDLLKGSFRQSPDYVIVGEVRGEEAYVMFQGMAAGFPAMGTIHASRVDDIINRLKTPPINLSASLLETLDIVVIMIHARDISESARRMKEVVEIEAVDSKTGNARTNTSFSWNSSDDTFSYRDYSWFLQEVARLKGVSLNEVVEEMKVRKKLLEWMKKNKIKRFKEVSRMISDYYKNPKKVLEKAKL